MTSELSFGAHGTNKGRQNVMRRMYKCKAFFGCEVERGINFGQTAEEVYHVSCSWLRSHICATMKMSTSHYQSCSLQLLTRFLLGRDHTTEKLHLCEVKTGLPLMRWSCHVNFEVSVRPPALHLEMSESIIVCDCGIVGVV